MGSELGMAIHLFITKGFPEPVHQYHHCNYQQWYHYGPISKLWVHHDTQYGHFHSIKCRWKYCLENDINATRTWICSSFSGKLHELFNIAFRNRQKWTYCKQRPRQGWFCPFRSSLNHHTSVNTSSLGLFSYAHTGHIDGFATYITG